MSANRVNTTTQDKLSFKKLIYGLDDALVTQKLAFGFFLDRAHKTSKSLFKREFYAQR